MRLRLTGLRFRIAAAAAGLLALAIIYLPKSISAGSQKRPLFLVERLWRLSRLHGIFGDQTD